jgi:hypothetical protein
MHRKLSTVTPHPTPFFKVQFDCVQLAIIKFMGEKIFQMPKTLINYMQIRKGSYSLNCSGNLQH